MKKIFTLLTLCIVHCALCTSLLAQETVTIPCSGIGIITVTMNPDGTGVMTITDPSGQIHMQRAITHTKMAEEIIEADQAEEDFSCDAPIINRQSSIVNNEPFRVALSLSPFSLRQFEQGYSFVVDTMKAATPAELQAIYRALGSTEMYCRIATKRHVTAEDVTDGKEDSNANVHTFDQGIALCRIAAALGIPMDPGIMCAYTYMDMDTQQAPRFEEYPEIFALQHGKRWEELSLDEICVVLKAYGQMVADSILATGCTVENWNLGNEANSGFAGISMGLETAVDPKLKKCTTLDKYMKPMFGVWWLKKHVWSHNAKAYAALKEGILSAYDKHGVDKSNVKFSTHIATVVSTPRCSAAFFRCLADNGYPVETAGISFYPSAPALSVNKKNAFTRTVVRINEKCGVPVFIAEYSYPTGPMSGPFGGWNKKLKGYEKDEQGQLELYRDVIRWGRQNGLCGIRYWAPDFEGWYTMTLFEFDENHVGTAKKLLLNHKTIVAE